VAKKNSSSLTSHFCFSKTKTAAVNNDAPDTPVGNNNATPPPRTTTVLFLFLLLGGRGLSAASLLARWYIWSFFWQLPSARKYRKNDDSWGASLAHHCSFESKKKKKLIFRWLLRAAAIYCRPRCAHRFLFTTAANSLTHHPRCASLWGWDFFRPPWKARAIRESDRRDEGVKNEHVRTSSSTHTQHNPTNQFSSCGRPLFLSLAIVMMILATTIVLARRR
jgi:hypothetical protein